MLTTSAWGRPRFTCVPQRCYVLRLAFGESTMSRESLSIIDNRTGEGYELEVTDGSIKAMDLRQIKTAQDDFGLITYDPGFANTGSCRSRITFVDGARGILRYRGYPIEQLAEKLTYPEVAYLIFHGELPDPNQKRQWETIIAQSSQPPTALKALVSTFDEDSRSMAILASLVAALSGFYPDATELNDRQHRHRHLHRLIGQVGTLAGYLFRHRTKRPLVDPDLELPYAENFLRMCFGDESGPSDPVVVRALDVLFTLHADHEQNCSANAMRSVGSSRPDPYLAAAAAIGALSGPLHGGANEAVLKMLEQIGSLDRVEEHINRVKAGEFRLMGFGHRVYKNYDPRAKIIKKLADQVFAVTSPSPLLEVALELERIALQDEYFVRRKLYPNVDFYSGLIYRAIGFPTWMFPVLFAVARTVGWAAQWEEFMQDPEQRIARPRQIFQGPPLRHLP